MDAFQVEVMARFWAPDHVVRHIGKIACVGAGLEPEDVRAMAEQERAKRERETFPGADPALSDHLAAEIGENVNRLLSGIADDVAETHRLTAQGGHAS